MSVHESSWWWWKTHDERSYVLMNVHERSWVFIVIKMVLQHLNEVDFMFKKLVEDYIKQMGPPRAILVFVETNSYTTNFSGREICEFLELPHLRKKHKCYIRCQEHLRWAILQTKYQFDKRCWTNFEPAEISPTKCHMLRDAKTSVLDMLRKFRRYGKLKTRKFCQRICSSTFHWQLTNFCIFIKRCSAM